MAGETYRRGIALFDYRAVEPDELSFNRGDSIVIFGTPFDGWFEGELNGRVGWCPANHLRLDVSTLDLSSAYKNLKASEPATPVQPQSGVVPEESSASTMCVLSQDNDTKRIFERLYETGIIHVKKKLENQEEWKSKEVEVSPAVKKIPLNADACVQAIRHSQFKASPKSTMLAKKFRSKTDVGEFAHCGEYLYYEGLKAKHFKAETARTILQGRRIEELSCQFKPMINEVSKKLRRDMPVVQKLTMYEQIKQEKLDSLRKSKEQEESKTLSFTPNILKYNLKEERQRIWTATDDHATNQWHREREARLKELQDKVDSERGVTHKPVIDENSKYLATSLFRRGEDIFEKLHRDAEKRSLKKEVERYQTCIDASELMPALQQTRRIEHRLWSLDLASLNQSSALQTPRTPRSSQTPRGESETRISLHEDAELRRHRKFILERQTAISESMARNHPKIDPKSEQLSRERLRRDCKAVLEALMLTDGSEDRTQITYDSFFQAVDNLVDFTVISRDLTDLSREEKEVLIDRIWYVIASEQVSDRRSAAIPVKAVLDAAMKIHFGAVLKFEDPENAELGKAAMGVFEEFVRMVSWIKLSSYPAHLWRQKAEKLDKRFQALKVEAIREFSALLRKCGVNINDVECKALFSYFDLEGEHSLDYIRFAKEVGSILSPRRRTIVRSIQTLESSEHTGTIFLSDILKRAAATSTPKASASKLSDVLSKMSNVQKRLQDIQGRAIFKNGDGVTTDYSKGESKLSLSSSSAESLSPSDICKQKPEQIPEAAVLQKRKQVMSLDAGSQLPRHVLLYQLSRKWLENRFSARQVQDEKEMEHCTFRPQINAMQANKIRNEPIGDRLYELAKTKESQCEQEPSWERRQLEECTFRPHTVKVRPTSAPVHTAELEASKRHIQRLRSKYAEEKGVESGGDNDSTSAVGYSPRTHKPRPTKETSPAQAHPLVIVEVNLPGGKVGKIAMQKGDDPTLLSKDFCLVHELSAASEERLADMLREQLIGLDALDELGNRNDGS